MLVFFAACPNQVIDIAFILDDSTSIEFVGGPDAWERDVLGWVGAIIRGFEILQLNVRIGVVKYSNTANLEIAFDAYNNISDLLPAIRNISYEGGRTNIADGLRTTRIDLAFREDMRKVAILFSDGRPTLEQERTLTEAENLKNTGVEIITVGVGVVDEEELKLIASSPDALHNYLVNDSQSQYNYARLDTVVPTLSKVLCELYETTTRSTIPSVTTGISTSTPSVSPRSPISADTASPPSVTPLSPVSPDTASPPSVSPLSPITTSVSPLSPISPDTASPPSVSPASPVSATSAKPPVTTGTEFPPFTLPPVGK